MLFTNRTRCLVLHDISLAPYTLIQKGERGTIVHTETDALGVYSRDVLLDRHHPGLGSWQNEAHLLEPELSSLECYQERHYYILGAIATAVACVLASVLLPPM